MKVLKNLVLRGSIVSAISMICGQSQALAQSDPGYSCFDLAQAQWARDDAWLARTGFDDNNLRQTIELQYYYCVGSIPAYDGPGQDQCTREYQTAMDEVDNAVTNLQFELDAAEAWLSAVQNGLRETC